MMQEMDLSLDEARVKVWMEDVNAELNAVRGVLNKVNTSLTEVAGSDDTLMQGIYQVGTAMGNAWDNMCKTFDTVQEKVLGSVGLIGGTVEILKNILNELKNRLAQ